MIQASQLLSIVQRIEKLEEEKKELLVDIKEVYSEAKSSGFDVKILKKIIRLRRKDAAERSEEASLMDTYLHALGM